MKPKKGDRWVAPSGRGFTIIEVSASVVTVEVDRVVRRGGQPETEQRRLEVSHNRYGTWSAPYTKKLKS